MNEYQKKLPEWLQKLQNERWQVEVALSGVIVFALYQLFEPVNVWESHFYQFLHFSLLYKYIILLCLMFPNGNYF